VRVLLDECVDRRLARDIAGHEVRTVPEAGWAGLKNGELLKRAQEQFDVFVTVDRNLPFQRDLSAFSIAVVVLRAQTNRVDDLRVLVPKLLTVIPTSKVGEVTLGGRRIAVTPNKQLQRTVERHRGDAARAPFQYARASRFMRQRAAAELRR
jgi:hypothetical protein